MKGLRDRAGCSCAEHGVVPFRMTFMRLEQRLDQGGCSPMQTSTQYRTFAQECQRLAKASKTERERAVLEEMAEAWKMLADEADRKGVGSES
jgi:hypothetical protein